MRLTTKQIEILKKVHAKNPDGSELDITQLKNALSYTASKQAVLCSVNCLVDRSLLARTGRVVRSGRNHTTVALTALGEAYVAPFVTSLKSVLIEDEE